MGRAPENVHRHVNLQIVDVCLVLHHVQADARLNAMDAPTPVPASVQEAAVIAAWGSVLDVVNRVHRNVVAVQEAAVCNVLYSVAIAAVINAATDVANHV